MHAENKKRVFDFACNAAKSDNQRTGLFWTVKNIFFKY